MVGRGGARLALAVIVTLAVAAGCSGGSQSSGSGNSADATIPLAKDSPTSGLFAALGVFQSCLKTDNVKFIGIPDANNPTSPANDPTYVQELTKCAARSHILQAAQAQQAAMDNLTPEQIKKANEGFLVWRRCMISHGWGMPEPKPDEKGRLFSFGTTSLPPFVPPPGQDVMTTGDYQKCAIETQKTNPDAFPG